MRKPSVKVREILRKNPQIDRSLLTESASLASELRRLGQLARPKQRMASPLERKRVTVSSVSSIQL